MRKQKTNSKQFARRVIRKKSSLQRRLKRPRPQRFAVATPAEQKVPIELQEACLRLLVRWPGERSELFELVPDDLVKRVMDAVLAERCKARRGTWSYDPIRHRNLLHVMTQLQEATAPPSSPAKTERRSAQSVEQRSNALRRTVRR